MIGRSVFFVVAFATAGCGCITEQRARELGALLHAENDERAEPSMRAAARALGAELLRARAEPLQLLNCNTTVQPAIREDVADGCIVAFSADGRAFWFKDTRGREKLGIRVASEELDYARLVRRGDTFILIHPDVVRRSVDKKTQCECDRSPKLVTAQPVFFAIVADDVRRFELRTSTVRVLQDVVEWERKAYAVWNGRTHDGWASRSRSIDC
jgi:hypothetical protein